MASDPELAEFALVEAAGLVLVNEVEETVGLVVGPKGMRAEQGEENCIHGVAGATHGPAELMAIKGTAVVAIELAWKDVSKTREGYSEGNRGGVDRTGGRRARGMKTLHSNANLFRNVQLETFERAETSNLNLKTW